MYSINDIFKKIKYKRIFIKEKNNIDFSEFHSKKLNVNFDKTISLVMPLYNAPINSFELLLKSIYNQTFDNWQLIIIDASNNGFDYQSLLDLNDSRIIYKKVVNKGISENTNVGLKLAKGDYICLVDHDDLLHPDALAELSNAFNVGHDFVYTDEVLFEDNVKNITHINKKNDFNKYELLSLNYLCHLVGFKKELLESAGYLNSQYDGSQDYDFFLRMMDCAKSIYHIPKYLYWWRASNGSTAKDIKEKEYVIDAGKNALLDYHKRHHNDVLVEPLNDFPTIYHTTYKIDESDYQIVLIGNNSHVNFNGDFIHIDNLNSLDLNRIHANHVLLIQSNILDLNKESINELLMYSTQGDTGFVSAKICKNHYVDNAGLDINGNKLYHKAPLNYVGNLAELRYVHAVEDVTLDCVMIKTELLKEYNNLLDQPIKLSNKLKEDGYCHLVNPFSIVTIK